MKTSLNIIHDPKREVHVCGACEPLRLHAHCLESLLLFLVPKVKTGSRNFPSTKVNGLEASGVECRVGRMLVVLSAGVCGIITGRDIVLLSQWETVQRPETGPGRRKSVPTDTPVEGDGEENESKSKPGSDV